ncbi:MAG TPA: hypothetical protein VGO29_00345 [Solirubrobacteraceae bacterium]|jgi:hypothetical protein|nr:hypothetical protein [Solirubrobacteraceae bacterium]
MKTSPTGTKERPLRSPGSSALIASSPDQRGGSNDDRNVSHDPALDDFARWFADWWTRRGRALTDPARDDA